MRGLRVFRLALRIAGRSLRRTPRRTVLLTAFIAVPLALATLVSTLTSTAVPSGDEFATRGLGVAVLRAELPGGLAGQALPPAEALRRGAETIRGLVPGVRDVEPVVSQDSRLVKGEREVAGSSFGLDGTSPVHEGRFTIESGSLAKTDGEAALSAAVARRLSAGIGSTVTVDGRELTVTGIVLDRADTTRAFALLTVPTAIAIAAQPGAGGDPRQATIAWHLTGVDARAARQALQGAGWRTLTRDDFAGKGSDQIGELPTLTLGLTLLTLALATLLVGAGFAVAASSSRREIGLLAVSGASPAQRRLVLTCNGFVLGVVATALGMGAGVGAAALAYPRVGRSLDQVWTQLRFDGTMLTLFVLLGLAGPVLAAWLAGRQTATMDPWTALHERPSATGLRAVRRTRRWTSIAWCAALVLLGLATLSASLALTALAAFVTVVAAAALIRVAVPRLARWAAVARPGMRVALRSHAAAPGRGAALIAAIGAVVTVAGLVMLGAGGLTERSAAGYRPAAPDGATVVDTHDTLPRTTVTDMARRLGATGVARINLAMPADGNGTDTYLLAVDSPAVACYRDPRQDPRACIQRAGFPDTNFWYLGIVEPDQMAVVLGRPLTDAESAAYRQGSVLALSGQVVDGGTVRTWDRDPRAGDGRQPGSLAAVVAADAKVYSEVPYAYISPEGARAAGFKQHPQVQYLMRGVGRPSEAAEDAARGLLSADSGGYGRLYVERGNPGTRQLGTVLMTCATILLGLAAVVSVLAVGLAGGELAPEFATLAAVGATARFRRALTAAYSAVTASLGVVLGVLALVAISPAQTRAMGVPTSPLAWLLLLGTGGVAVLIAAVGGWVTSPRPVSLVRRID
ncbi:FtsX-like permease family protein [Dactylosporangium sp. NPDC000521]|uniref:ABC transporter permease n=1 Tax=Dactylosporangium sp. NPDC000521 TaxID=3363975 RepID=UPI00367EEE1B